jgi:hypothetical protein
MKEGIRTIVLLIVPVALIMFMVWVWQQNDANLQTSYVMAKDTGLGKIIY